jgi:quercetin 2,3-dioxygenase
VAATPTPIVRRAGDRFRTVAAGRETWHAFSFGAHYDPASPGFGLLVAANDERLEPGGGYDPHEHRDLEIVSWVLAGALHHAHGDVSRSVVTTGYVQALSAGTGVTHSEHAGPGAPAHLLQMWVAPASSGLPPAYAAADVSPVLGTGRWVALASGRPADQPAVAIRQPSACLRVARLSGSQSLALPSAPYAYVHVARGEVELEGCGALAAGDAALITDASGQRLTVASPRPGSDLGSGAERSAVSGPDPGPGTGPDTGPGNTADTGAAEVLVWEMRDSLFGPG